jgi:hypothetical protein
MLDRSFLMGRDRIHGWEVLVGFAVPLYMLWLVASEPREVPGGQVLSTDRRGDHSDHRGDRNPELAPLPHSGERPTAPATARWRSSVAQYLASRRLLTPALSTRFCRAVPSRSDFRLG